VIAGIVGVEVEDVMVGEGIVDGVERMRVKRCCEICWWYSLTGVGMVCGDVERYAEVILGGE